VLRSREFGLFYAGQATSMLGDAMVPVALSFAVLARFRDAGSLGLVLTAETAPLVLTLLLGGVVADRVSRRRLLLVMDVIRAVVQGAAALLLAGGNWSLWQLAALFAVHGAATGLSSPALIGMVSATVPEAGRQRANALRSLAQSGGAVAGPAIAGLVAGIGNGALAIALNAGTYAVSAGCLAAMRPIPGRAREEGGAGVRSYLSDLRGGWQEFRSRTWIWVIVAQFGLFHLLVFPEVLVLGAVVSKRSLGGAGAWGAALAAFGAGSVVGGLLMLRWHPRRPMAVAVGFGSAFALFAAALIGPAPLVLVAATGAVGGIGFGVFDALWNTALSVHVPAELLGRVSAYDWFGSVALLPVGYAIVGPLAGSLGVGATLLMAAVSWTVLSVLALLVPSVRRLRAGTG
jgi:MFS family permease